MAVSDSTPRLAGGPVGSVGIVAVSGGPDSVALLLLLADQAPRHGWRLRVAHAHHGLRGAESDGDERFTADLADRLGLPFDSARLDTASAAQRPGGNPQASARPQRYARLAPPAPRPGARRVATGHTADDQAETVLLNLLRGTGLRGLRGIARRRPLGSALLLRPMLAIRRAQVLALLEERGQPFRTDASNFDRGFTRNRLRHELLPRLVADHQPRLVEHLAALAEQARIAQRLLVRRARRLVQQCERPRAGPLIILDGTPLAQQRPELLGEMLIHLCEREHWPRGRVGQRHWHRAAAVCRGQARQVELPEGLVVRRVGSVVQMGMELRQPGRAAAGQAD
ncbi:MAG TPA: tRNA lysidine(34) synthetase TilS [Gemmatales bacterium]|nr:tRNA lysidine(34) synthetase TilS [Gemmatales bacterium]